MLQRSILPSLALFICSFFTPCLLSTVLAGDIDLAWTANSEPDISGYNLYFGTQSGVYDAPGSPIFIPPPNTTTTLTGLQNGQQYFLTITAVDLSGNESIPAIQIDSFISEDVTSDTTPPSIPSIDSVVANSATDVTIIWSEATDDVGVTGYTLYRDGTPVVTTPNTSHADQNLTPETTYVYTVKAHDAADNSSALSAGAPITTLAPTDTTSPTVSITSPSENDTVSGMVTISGTATDNIGVLGVQFQLDGANLGAEDTTNDYSVDWDTASVTPGTYTLTAIARDLANNTTTSTPVTVTVTVEATSNDLEITNLQVQSGQAYVVVPDGLLNGALTYIDRSYTFTTIPPTLTNTTYIRPANNDKNSTGSSFMSFDVNQSVTIYVAHDDRITPKPTWLNSFNNTGDILVTSDTDFEIYSQTFPAGTINIGGNRESGKGGSMYSVAVMSEGGPTADTTPPSIPTIDSVVANFATEVTISWSEATDNVEVTDYTLYRDGTPVVTTSNTSHVDPNLTPETTYIYTVKAHDFADNSSGLSAETSVTTPAPPDTTPPSATLITPTEGDTVSGIVTISATATDNVEVMGVQFQLDGANLGAEDTTADYSIDWDTSSVTPGTHTLTAIARDAADNTTNTTTVTVEVEPIGLEITNMQVQSGEAYVVFPDGLLPNTLPYIDRTYVFTTIPAPLTSTTYIQTANNDKNSTGSTFVSFDVNQPVTVYVAHDDRISTKPAWLNSFTPTGGTLITSDTEFDLYSQTFPAGTINLGGNRESGKGGSMYSVAVVTEGGAPIVDTTPPSSPSIDSVIANSTTVVTITWSGATDNVGVTSYTLYRDGTSVITTPNTSHADPNLTPDTTYVYTVKAHDIANNSSALSEGASVTTPAQADTTPPSIPSILSAIADSSTQATISWEAATDNIGVTGYNVYRDAIMISTTTDLNYVDAELTPFTSYSYTIQAIDEAGNVSAMSLATSVTTEDVVTNNNGTAKLSWQKNTESDLSHYVVYYGTTSQVYDQIIPVGLTQTPNAPSFTIAELAPGTYYFTVRAVDTSGNEGLQAPEATKTISN